MKTVELLSEEIGFLEDAFEENSRNPAQIRILIRSTFAAIEALVDSMMERAIPGIVKKSIRVYEQLCVHNTPPTH